MSGFWTLYVQILTKTNFLTGSFAYDQNVDFCSYSYMNTVDIWNPNVRFDKLNKILIGYRTFRFQIFVTKPNNSEQNQFQTGRTLV